MKRYTLKIAEGPDERFIGEHIGGGQFGTQRYYLFRRPDDTYIVHKVEAAGDSLFDAGAMEFVELERLQKWPEECLGRHETAERKAFYAMLKSAGLCPPNDLDT